MKHNAASTLVGVVASSIAVIAGIRPFLRRMCDRKPFITLGGDVRQSCDNVKEAHHRRVTPSVLFRRRGGRWWHLTTSVVDSYQQLETYSVDRYGVFVQGSYRFNAGAP